jgi:hypothetical protein
MQWQTYGNKLLGTYIYLSSGTYVPGFVNCVKVMQAGSEFQLIVTDGYKQQHGGFYTNADLAKEAGELAMLAGAGGWKACFTGDPEA